jgi:hypothetical protein
MGSKVKMQLRKRRDTIAKGGYVYFRYRQRVALAIALEQILRTTTRDIPSVAIHPRGVM